MTMSRLACVTLASLLALPHAFSQPTPSPAPTTMTVEQDHQRTMELLKITSLRRGADAKEDSPYAANSDESKANAYTNVPDPRVLNDGQRITTPQMW